MDMRTGGTPPRSSDLMGELAWVEQHFPVLQWTVAGIPLWPLARIRWFLHEWAHHYVTPTPAVSASGAARRRLQRLCLAPAAATIADLQDSTGRDRGPSRRDIVFLSDGVSYARLGGRWVDRFCDPLIALARQRGLSSALWVPSHEWRTPRASPSTFVQPLVDRGNAIGALRSLFDAGGTQLPGHAALLASMESRGLHTSPLAARKLVSDGLRVRALADRYGRLLQRARPRLAFVVGYYSVEAMAFVLACRELGIVTTDIQHGVQGELHPAYSGWPAAPDGLHALLPDAFWVWSAWEQEAIQQWCKATRHAALVGGNPWMRLWNGTEPWPGVEGDVSRARKLKAQAGLRPTVLVTLQYGFSAAEQLEPLARLLREAGESVQFWVRLHPLMLERREEVRALLQAAGSCDLDEPSDLALQALLPLADVHMTHSSSVVIEAAQFGVRSVITTLFGAELFRRHCEAGWAEVQTGDAATLLDTLRRVAAAPRKPADDSTASAGAALDQLWSRQWDRSP